MLLQLHHQFGSKNWHWHKLEAKQVLHATLATCPWNFSFGWCLPEGYRNRDQRRPMGPCGSERTLAMAMPGTSASNNNNLFWQTGVELLSFTLCHR